MRISPKFIKLIEEFPGSQEQENVTEEPGSRSSSDFLTIIIGGSLISELS